MVVALITGVIVVACMLGVIIAACFDTGGGCGCTGDALSGFLPCDRYPDCVNDE